METIGTEKPSFITRVRYSETDAMQVAHHSSYVMWFEAARVEWMRDNGLSYKALEETGVSLPVSDLQITYRSSAVFDDELAIYATMTEAKSRRFRFDYKVVKTEDNSLLVIGSTTHIPANGSGQAVRAPQGLLERCKAAM